MLVKNPSPGQPHTHAAIPAAKSISILIGLLLVTLLSSACGSQATPTANRVDVENTQIAAVVTMLAGTQAALPTATPSPTATVTDTATPALSPTIPPLPTLGATLPAIVPTGNLGPADPCVNKVLPAVLQGEKIRIRIDNPTKAKLMLSVNLQPSGPQSTCGYRSYSLAAGESLVIQDLVAGCYTLWAWNPEPDAYFIVTNGTSCLNTSQNWTFDISTSEIKLRP